MMISRDSSSFTLVFAPTYFNDIGSPLSGPVLKTKFKQQFLLSW